MLGSEGIGALEVVAIMTGSASWWISRRVEMSPSLKPTPAKLLTRKPAGVGGEGGAMPLAWAVVAVDEKDAIVGDEDVVGGDESVASDWSTSACSCDRGEEDGSDAEERADGIGRGAVCGLSMVE